MTRAVAGLALVVSMTMAGGVAARQSDAFEVASVKPAGDAPGEVLSMFGSGCDGSFPRVEKTRFRVTTTLFALMTWAYQFNDRGGCSFATHGNLITGGPSWVRTERFEIDAVMPDGVPEYSAGQFLDGAAPRLEAMLRRLLEQRFKLVVRSQTREVPLYALVSARGGAKVPPAKPDEPAMLTIRPEQDSNGGAAYRLVIHNAPMGRAALMLGLVLRRPVVDRTGLTGNVSFELVFASPDAAPNNTSAPSLVTAFREQLGLRVDETRGPVTALVIESVERPSAN